MKWALLPLLLCAIAASGDWKAALDCKAIGDEAERLACFDRAVDTPTHEVVKPVAEREVEPEGLFGKSDAEINQALIREPKVDEISSAVVKVARNAYKKLVLTLDNDQIWRQIDSERLSVAVGDSVVVQRTFSGAYMLRKSERRRGIRVRRVR